MDCQICKVIVVILDLKITRSARLYIVILDLKIVYKEVLCID